MSIIPDEGGVASVLHRIWGWPLVPCSFNIRCVAPWCLSVLIKEAWPLCLLIKKMWPLCHLVIKVWPLCLSVSMIPLYLSVSSNKVCPLFVSVGVAFVPISPRIFFALISPTVVISRNFSHYIHVITCCRVQAPAALCCQICLAVLAWVSCCSLRAFRIGVNPVWLSPAAVCSIAAWANAVTEELSQTLLSSHVYIAPLPTSPHN